MTTGLYTVIKAGQTMHGEKSARLEAMRAARDKQLDSAIEEIEQATNKAMRQKAKAERAPKVVLLKDRKAYANKSFSGLLKLAGVKVA